MSVAGNHAAGLEGVPEVISDILLGELGSNLVLHSQDPAQDLLGGQSVQRASQTQQTGTVAQERVAESTANQMGSVSRNIATLVVTVQGQVQAQQIVEVLVLGTALAQQLGKVVGPILGGIQLLCTNGINLVGTENKRRHTRNLSQQRNAVVKGRLPVLGLVETLLVSLGKLRLGVESGDRDRQLGHGVHGLRERLNQVQDVLGQVRLLSQFAGESADLRCRGDLAGQEEPEHGFGQHLCSRCALGKLLLAILDGLAVEADTLVGIQHRALPEHGLEATHSTNDVANLDLANGFIALSLHLLKQLALGGDNLLQGGLQVGLGGSIGSGREQRPRGLESISPGGLMGWRAPASMSSSLPEPAS